MGHKYNQTSFQSVFTLCESTKPHILIQKSMQETIPSCFTLENTEVAYINSTIFLLNHGLETCASWSLFRHSRFTAPLIIEQNRVIDDPGFQNESKDRKSVLACFVFIKDQGFL